MPKQNLVFKVVFLIVLFCELFLGNITFAQPADTLILQLKWKHQFQFAGYYAAKAKGFYKQNGLEVIIKEVEKEESTSVVCNGKADFGIANSDILVSRVNGSPVVLLAAIFQHSPFVFVALDKPKNLNIHSFAGKTIMLEPHAAELLAYLKYEQVPLSGLTYLPHDFSVEQLVNQNVFAMSAYITDEVYLLDSMQLDYLIFNPRAGGIDFFGDVLFTSEKVLKEKPELVKKFVAASLEGWKYALENDTEIIDLIYNQYSKVKTKEHLAFEARNTKQLIMPEVVEIGYINKSRWQRIGEIYAEMDMIPENFSLTGFFYEPNEKVNVLYLYFLAGGGIIIFAISLIAYRFYRLSSKLKKESEARKFQENRLILLEKQYRELIEYAPYPIIITQSHSGKTLYANQLACEKFEVSRTWYENTNYYSFFCESADAKYASNQIRKQGFVRNLEVELITANNSKFWAILSAVHVKFNGSDSVFTAILDISERIAMEKELRELNNTKNKFFSIIAHDLRGPVGTLNQFLTYVVLKFKDLDENQLLAYLNKLNQDASNTYSLLENLLVWAGTQKGEIKLSKSANSLSELIKRTIELLQPTAEQKSIKLVYELDSNVIFDFDANLMATVSRNLITNAIKYSFVGSKVIISISENEKSVVFTVTDFGVGMSEEVSKSLFDISAKNNSQKGTSGESGTGLGLILCSDFVQLHKGTIKVESTFGEGTKFTVSLPK